MNSWQILRQLAYLTRAAQWASGQPLFLPQSVVVSPAILDEEGENLSYPVCLLTVMEPTPDIQQPDLSTTAFSVRAMTCIPGDNRGTAALLGANRTALTSANRGLLEIAEPLLAAIRRLNDASGVRLQAVHSSGPAPAIIGDRKYMVWADHKLSVQCVDAKFFHPPLNLVATGGSGQVVLSWTLPPSRFDYRRVILRRASGATPPADATSGTGISLGGSPDGASATGVTDSVAAGTYSYSLFAAYDDFGVGTNGIDAPASDKDFSAALSRASVVVT